MSRNYTPEFKKKIVRLHEEEGRTYKSVTAEYGVSKASITDRHITSDLAVRTLQKALDPSIRQRAVCSYTATKAASIPQSGTKYRGNLPDIFFCETTRHVEVPVDENTCNCRRYEVDRINAAVRN